MGGCRKSVIRHWVRFRQRREPSWKATAFRTSSNGCVHRYLHFMEGSLLRRRYIFQAYFTDGQVLDAYARSNKRKLGSLQARLHKSMADLGLKLPSRWNPEGAAEACASWCEIIRRPVAGGEPYPLQPGRSPECSGFPGRADGSAFVITAGGGHAVPWAGCGIAANYLEGTGNKHGSPQGRWRD